MIATPLTSYQIIQSTLVAVKVKDALEDIVFLNVNYEAFTDATAVGEPFFQVECPTLKHHTFALRSQYISNGRIWTPDLTSLHVVLDDCYLLHNYWRYDKEFFPDRCPSLHHYTLSGKKDRVTSDLLLRCIDPVLGRDCTLPLLTI